MTRPFPALTLVLVAATGLARAASPLEVTEAWVAEAPPGARAQAAYLQLRNAGTAPLALVSAASPAFASVELHRTVHEGGVARMEKLERLSLAPGERARLAPGGLHLMLIGPRERLAEGALVPIELQLEGGPRVSVDAPVRREAPTADAHHGHHHH